MPAAPRDDSLAVGDVPDDHRHKCGMCEIILNKDGAMREHLYDM
jgi:hypothetical protein